MQVAARRQGNTLADDLGFSKVKEYIEMWYGSSPYTICFHPGWRCNLKLNSVYRRRWQISNWYGTGRCSFKSNMKGRFNVLLLKLAAVLELSRCCGGGRKFVWDWGVEAEISQQQVNSFFLGGDGE